MAVSSGQHWQACRVRCCSIVEVFPSHLIGARGDCQFSDSLVVTEPSPSRALDGDGGGGQFFLHGFDGSKVAFDGIEKGPGRFSGVFLGTQVLPENRVVDVTATIELEGAVQPDN